MMGRELLSFFMMLQFGILIAILRIAIGVTVEPEAVTWVAVYKAFAHIYIGVLGTQWWFERERWQGYLFGALCVIEVLVAVASRLYF